jgi:hypothetical protein
MRGQIKGEPWGQLGLTRPVPAVPGGKHDSRIARRRGSTGPNAREPRGSCGVPGGGRPPAPASRSLRDALAAAWNKATSLLPEQPLQLTTLVEYAQSMVSGRNEQATAATRRDMYRADPRAYIRIAAVLRERITAGELVPGHATPSITRLCADHGVARQTAAHALHVLQDAGLVYRSPDSATTSATTCFPGFADPGGQLREREPGSEETLLPPGTALCPLLQYLRGVAAARNA